MAHSEAPPRSSAARAEHACRMSIFWGLLFQIRVVLDVGLLLCPFRSRFVVEGNRIRCDHITTALRERTRIPASRTLRGLGSRGRFVESMLVEKSMLVEIGDGVGRGQVTYFESGRAHVCTPVTSPSRMP